VYMLEMMFGVCLYIFDSYYSAATPCVVLPLLHRSHRSHRSSSPLHRLHRRDRRHRRHRPYGNDLMPYSNATFYLSILLAEIGAVVLVLVLFRFRSELGCCLAKLAGLLVAVLAVISPFRE
jgi:hypothetical protein